MVEHSSSRSADQGLVGRLDSELEETEVTPDY